MLYHRRLNRLSFLINSSTTNRIEETVRIQECSTHGIFSISIMFLLWSFTRLAKSSSLFSTSVSKNNIIAYNHLGSFILIQFYDTTQSRVLISLSWIPNLFPGILIDMQTCHFCKHTEVVLLLTIASSCSGCADYHVPTTKDINERLICEQNVCLLFFRQIRMTFRMIWMIRYQTLQRPKFRTKTYYFHR